MTTNLKTIDQNIAQVRTNGDAFNALIHDTAMMILEHALEHGDCSRAQLLVMAMPASMRRTSLIAWFSKYSPIVTKNNDDSWNAKMHKELTALGKPNPLYRPFNIEAARADPWFMDAVRNREQNPRTYTFEDIVKMVEQLGARLEKQIEDGAIVDDDLASAKEVALTIQALHFTKKRADEQAANETTPATEEDKAAALKAARVQYKEKFGKRAFAGWDLPTISAKLAEPVEVQANERQAA